MTTRRDYQAMLAALTATTMPCHFTIPDEIYLDDDYEPFSLDDLIRAFNDEDTPIYKFLLTGNTLTIYCTEDDSMHDLPDELRQQLRYTI